MLSPPGLVVAADWYAGVGHDSLTWSQEGVLNNATYADVDQGIGLTYLLGYQFNGYISFELFGYQSNPAYLKQSDSDYLEHFMVGFGPRINLLNFSRSSWTPWVSWYATYQSIDRYREKCCDEYPTPIHTLMDGMGNSRAFGLDIKLAENTFLQLGVRDSSVWAGWSDPNLDDGETTAKEIFLAVYFHPRTAD